jgi:hypothetical protein
MAINIGQSSKGATASATSQATSAVATAATGSIIIGGGAFQGTFSSLTDNKSNSPYVQVDSERVIDTANAAKIRMYYFQNAAGGSGHTTTLATTTAQPITALMAEITGAALTGALIASNGGNDTSSPYGNAVSITPAAGNYLLMAMFGGNSGSNPATQAETQGFTILSAAQETNGATFWTACLAYKIVTADGVTAYTAQFTESGATEGAVILAAFAEAASGGKRMMIMGVG